jgi:hypothetical protein
MPGNGRKRTILCVLQSKKTFQARLAVVQMTRPKSLPSTGHYNLNYGNFQTDLYAQIRHEAFGGRCGSHRW